MGFDVTAVQNGTEAVRLLGEHAFDAVLTDLNMPGMTGLELLRTGFPSTRRGSD